MLVGFGISRGDANKIVKFARDEMAFQNLGHFCNRGLEGLNVLLSGADDLDLDKDLQLKADLHPIQTRGVARDHSGCFQKFDAPVAGRQ